MTEGTRVIIELLGGVALLLWGVRMVRTGIMRAWGERLKHFLELRLTNRFSAFAAGAAATAILGSGTAMALIIAGLAAAGTIGTMIGLAVLLGADVGSAVVSSVFASGASYASFASPILLFLGFCIFSMTREFRPHNVGRIFIGLGLMLAALRLIMTATVPLREASFFHAVLAAIGNDPVLAFLIGAAVAWICHSTLAVVLLIASFLANGSLELGGAISLILGLKSLPLNPVDAAVVFHTAFNLIAAMLFLPLAGWVAKLMERVIPDLQKEADNLAAPRYLDQMALATPMVALSNAMIETVRMSELLDRMFEVALVALRTGSVEKLKELKVLDERLNAYQSSVHTYLSDLAQSELEKTDARRALEIMLYASNLEHAGDIIHLNLMDRIKAKAKQSISFNIKQLAALDDLCLIIHQSLRLATGVLTSGDIEGARRLIGQKDIFRTLENRMIDEHFRESGKVKGASLRKSALYVDLIRDLHRINSHIVSAGYPIVEAAGLLRETRLRDEGRKGDGR